MLSTVVSRDPSPPRGAERRRNRRIVPVGRGLFIPGRGGRYSLLLLRLLDAADVDVLRTGLYADVRLAGTDLSHVALH